MKEVGKAREDSADKGTGAGTVLYEFPLFRISYCGTNEAIPEAFSFVAKENDGK